MSTSLTNHSSHHSSCTAKELVGHLFQYFDPRDAEPWDKVGLLVGDPSTSIATVGVALDACFETVERARELGCQALVTHHPVALEIPFPLTSRAGGGRHPQDAIVHALAHHVALIAMHTNLDRAVYAAQELANLFELTFTAPLEPASLSPGEGRLGQICTSEGITLQKISQIIQNVYGEHLRAFCPPRCDENTVHTTVAILSGSFPSNLIPALISSHATLLITGEIGYHHAVELQSAGISVAILGHDTSELIYSDTLTRALSTMEGAHLKIVSCDSGVRWHTI